MRDQKKAEDIATQRVQLLSPLLAEGMDPAKARQIKDQICEQAGISERTLRRYLAEYKTHGFAGLKPKGKAPSRTEEAVPPHILEQAIANSVFPGYSDRSVVSVAYAGKSCGKIWRMKNFICSGLKIGWKNCSIKSN